MINDMRKYGTVNSANLLTKALRTNRELIKGLLPATKHQSRQILLKFSLRTMASLEVAIIGAGVGGLALAVALQHNPNLNVNVYERATELQEIGALVGVAPNGLRTLEKLGVLEVLDENAGWRNPSGIPMIFKQVSSRRLSKMMF